MGQSIVVGLDGSRESLAAAEWACAEARLRGLPVELLQVWPRRTADPPLESTLRKALRGAEIEISARHPGVEISTLRTPGDAPEVLAAAAGRAALLVLGSRGLGAVSGFLLGSTGQSVLAHAPCPVVLVRPRGRATGEVWAADDSAPRDVVLGLDLDRPCDALLGFAFETAAVRDAPLLAVHVRRPAGEFGYAAGPIPPGLDEELTDEARQAVRGALEPWTRTHPRVRTEVRVTTGRPARELIDAVRPAALLVVGRRVRESGFGVHVGPVTHAVVHHAPCPVAVVPYR